MDKNARKHMKDHTPTRHNETCFYLNTDVTYICRPPPTSPPPRIYLPPPALHLNHASAPSEDEACHTMPEICSGKKKLVGKWQPYSHTSSTASQVGKRPTRQKTSACAFSAPVTVCSRHPKGALWRNAPLFNSPGVN